MSFCSVDGCCEKHYGKGLCKKHYRQSDAYKEHLKKYQQSDAYKESQRKYRQSDAYKEMRWKLICFIFFIASLFDFRVGITGAFICSCFLWDKELSVYGKVFETNKETRNK